MSYLLDRKIKQKKFFKIAGIVVVLFLLFLFRANVFSGFSKVSYVIFRPFLVVGNNTGKGFGSLGVYFHTKRSLERENQNLQQELNSIKAKLLNYDIVVSENEALKEAQGRANEADLEDELVLAAILTKPNQSPYDTLVVDVGSELGVRAGNLVFALGYVPIGRVAQVFSSSSKVVLFSSPGEKTQVIIPEVEVFMELVGRGGGNFEMTLPKDINLSPGDRVTLPGISARVVAEARTLLSDPRNPFNKVLLVSLVNVQELKYVEVKVE